MTWGSFQNSKTLRPGTHDGRHHTLLPLWPFSLSLNKNFFGVLLLRKMKSIKYVKKNLFGVHCLAYMIFVLKSILQEDVVIFICLKWQARFKHCTFVPKLRFHWRVNSKACSVCPKLCLYSSTILPPSSAFPPFIMPCWAFTKRTTSSGTSAFSPQHVGTDAFWDTIKLPVSIIY